MGNLKKGLLLLAHVGICSWIIYIAFQTTKMPVEAVAFNYIACAAGVFLLSKVKSGPKKNV